MNRRDVTRADWYREHREFRLDGRAYRQGERRIRPRDTAVYCLVIESFCGRDADALAQRARMGRSFRQFCIRYDAEQKERAHAPPLSR